MLKITKMYEGVFKRAFSGRSKASAIKAKCLDCTCLDKKEITLCNVKSCPLWIYRPYQEKKEQGE
jgi:hypothetical protein